MEHITNTNITSITFEELPNEVITHIVRFYLLDGSSHPFTTIGLTCKRIKTIVENVCKLEFALKDPLLFKSLISKTTMIAQFISRQISNPRILVEMITAIITLRKENLTDFLKKYPDDYKLQIYEAFLTETDLAPDAILELALKNEDLKLLKYIIPKCEISQGSAGSIIRLAFQYEDLSLIEALQKKFDYSRFSIVFYNTYTEPKTKFFQEVKQKFPTYFPGINITVEPLVRTNLIIKRTSFEI